MSEDILKELESLLQFARERESFGIQTDIQNRPYDDGEGFKQKGNPRGEAFGAGYSEASRHFINEIQRRIDATKPAEEKWP